jgi:hypothetical protein
MMLLNTAECDSTRQRRYRRSECDRQPSDRQPTRLVVSQPHGSQVFSALGANVLTIERSNGLWIRDYILLDIQIIQQLEIRIHLVILV